MAETFRFSCSKPARLIYSSVAVKSAPKLDNGQTAEARFGGTFGIEDVDFKECVRLMVDAIKSECGSFSGNPDDYYLSCQSSKTASRRVMQSAELKANLPGVDSSAKMKIMEKAEARVKLYEPYAGILVANSKFDVELARMDGGKIIDIQNTEHARAQAEKDLFYSGAYVVPAVAFKGFRRKKLDDKDGCTAYLQNCLFLRKGEKLSTGSGPSNNEVFGNFAGYSDVDPLANAPSSRDEEQPAF